jgi:GAF domain/ANTAR domain
VARTINGDAPSAGSGSEDDLSSRFVAELPITGASISVVVGDRTQSTISASDARAAAIDELQFVLGEGPHWDALLTGKPIAAPYLRRTDRTRWPILAHGLADIEVGALFAFPLRLGAATIGVANLYRTKAGALGIGDTLAALTLSRLVAPHALRSAMASADSNTPPSAGLAAEMRREVHQATGMVLVQLNVAATEAFARLKAYAFANGISIQEVAKDVVERRLSFRDMP